MAHTSIYRKPLNNKKLNGVKMKDNYPLPCINDTLDALAGARCFYSLDLASGYWQVGLSE